MEMDHRASIFQPLAYILHTKHPTNRLNYVYENWTPHVFATVPSCYETFFDYHTFLRYGNKFFLYKFSV